MSKKRNRHQSLSVMLNRTTSSFSTEPKPIFGSTMTKSFFIPRKDTSSSRFDLTDFHKEKVFSKNISFFREQTNQNDPGMLCFMSSLRHNKTVDHDFSKTTEIRPFSVSDKRTMNQHTTKRIFDVKAKQSRISTAYYRWHNRSGKNTINGVEFECSLRDYNQGMNPEEIGFSNFVQPIKYEKVEPKYYQEQEILCPRQRKLFRLKAK